MPNDFFGSILFTQRNLITMSTGLSSPKRLYDIAPIPTFYKGIKFRSRLEIRWAVFFDRLSWDWLYEPKRFKLTSSTYLPDFYFPDVKMYAEVKPDQLNEIERRKCIELSEFMIDNPILQLIGVPELSSIKTIINGGNGDSVIPVELGSKFYPLFYYSVFNAFDFDKTTEAILEAKTFEF